MISRFDMFYFWEILILMLKKLSLNISEKYRLFLKTQTKYRPIFSWKVFTTDQNYFYRPVCHHCISTEPSSIKSIWYSLIKVGPESHHKLNIESMNSYHKAGHPQIYSFCNACLKWFILCSSTGSVGPFPVNIQLMII